MLKHVFKFGNLIGFINVIMMYGLGNTMCESVLNSDMIKKISEAKGEFDVIMLEYYCNDCMQGIAWKLKLPVIGLSSSPLMPWHYNSVGNPNDPGYIPSVFTASTDEMTFSMRLWNWFNVHFLQFVYR